MVSEALVVTLADKAAMINVKLLAIFIVVTPASYIDTQLYT